MFQITISLLNTSRWIHHNHQLYGEMQLWEVYLKLIIKGCDSFANHLNAKLNNLNFHKLEVMSRYRDPQLHVGKNYLTWDNTFAHVWFNVWFNYLKPEFTIFIFIHYKPRIAVAIFDLQWMKMIWSGWRMKKYAVIKNSSTKMFVLKTLCVRNKVILHICKMMLWCIVMIQMFKPLKNGLKKTVIALSAVRVNKW